VKLFWPRMASEQSIKWYALSILSFVFFDFQNGILSKSKSRGTFFEKLYLRRPS
jgi:hypothetical protein